MALSENASVGAGDCEAYNAEGLIAGVFQSDGLCHSRRAHGDVSKRKADSRKADDRCGVRRGRTHLTGSGENSQRGEDRQNDRCFRACWLSASRSYPGGQCDAQASGLRRRVGAKTRSVCLMTYQHLLCILSQGKYYQVSVGPPAILTQKPCWPACGWPPADRKESKV